jgi:hypothetical protein
MVESTSPLDSSYQLYNMPLGAWWSSSSACAGSARSAAAFRPGDQAEVPRHDARSTGSRRCWSATCTRCGSDRQRPLDVCPPSTGLLVGHRYQRRPGISRPSRISLRDGGGRGWCPCPDPKAGATGPRRRTTECATTEGDGRRVAAAPPMNDCVGRSRSEGLHCRVGGSVGRWVGGWLGRPSPKGRDGDCGCSMATTSR